MEITDKLKPVYRLLSNDLLPCKTKRIGSKKITREKCWLVQFLDGMILAIVNYQEAGTGGAVIVIEEGKKDKVGYFHSIATIEISKTALRKYLKNNDFHYCGFNIFQ